MLTDGQIESVWKRKLEAEVRSLYFGDLANRYSRIKQAITAVSFFLSSGAAATVIAKAPLWVPVLQSAIVALVTAYSIGVGLERRATTMAKLHSVWNQIAVDYDRLWNHAYDAGAEVEFEDLVRREKDPSELATTEAPDDQERLGKWQDYVFQQHGLKNV